MSVKTICVYCSSSDALDAAYFDAATALGTAIAASDHTLIFGGGRTGLMGTVARSVQASGGQVIGVIPEALMPYCYTSADEVITTRDMRERKAVMEARADAFIGLPGGFGTLEEMLEIITLKQLKFHNKPIVMMNTMGFYEHLLDAFEHIFEAHFAKQEFRQLYYVAPDAEAVLSYIMAYQPIDLPGKVS